MSDLTRIPLRDGEGSFRVVVESPRGSTVKLKYERELGTFRLARPLILGMRYPFDWGFIPSTEGPDGDPVDALVLLDAPTYPGVVLDCRALGVLQIDQKGRDGKRERNDRIIALPELAPRLDSIEQLPQLPDRTRKEIEQFFINAVALADKDMRVLGWGGPEEAEQLIEDSTLK